MAIARGRIRPIGAIDMTMVQLPAKARPTLLMRFANSLDWAFLAMILWLALVLAIMPSPAAAQSGAPFTIAETGRSYSTLQRAVDAIGDQRGTISIAPGTYRQCAVQQAGVIIYTAEEYGTVTLDRTACEGKAALVLRGLEQIPNGDAARLVGIAPEVEQLPPGVPAVA